MLKYPTEIIITSLQDIEFDMDGFYDYLLENKIMPPPREKYKVKQRVVELSKVVLLRRKFLLRLGKEGLLTIAKYHNKLYIIRDDLWTGLCNYLNKKSASKNLLPHCIAA